MLLINSITYSVCPHITVKRQINTNNKVYFIAQLHAKHVSTLSLILLHIL